MEVGAEDDEAPGDSATSRCKQRNTWTRSGKKVGGTANSSERIQRGKKIDNQTWNLALEAHQQLTKYRDDVDLIHSNIASTLDTRNEFATSRPVRIAMKESEAQPVSLWHVHHKKL